MNIVMNQVTIDVMQPGEIQTIHAVQDECYSRNVRLTLLCNGDPWQIPEKSEIAVRYGRVDLSGGYYDTLPDGSPAGTYENNVISLMLVPQMLARAGMVMVQAEINKEEQRLVTFSFRLQVAGNPAVGILGPETYINAQKWLEKELDVYIEKVKEKGELLGGTMAGPINMNGQVLGGLNAPVSESEASTKGYTDMLVRKAAPRNLLDNSDFRNPVNQRGQDSYAPATNTIDRWFLWTSDDTGELQVKDGFIRITGNVGHGTFCQKFASGILDKNKIYTLAYKLTDGTIHVRINPISYDWDPGVDLVTTMSLEAGGTVDILWLALYEGEYTLDTLPEYQPKGYGVELTACQRYCVLIPHTVEGFIIGYGVASTDTVAYITVDLPGTVQEYTNVMPTIMGAFQLRGNGDVIDVDNVVCYSVNGHKLVLECRVSSGLASMQFYVLRALENVLISKEL